MGEALFFMLTTFALGGAALYFGLGLLRHKLPSFKILGVVMVFFGLGVGSFGVNAFIKRQEDEDVLDTLRDKVREAERVEAAKQKVAPGVPPLEVRLDSATGCEYLVAPNGTLVPRADSTGRQVCK